jgi:hypothetical protein
MLGGQRRLLGLVFPGHFLGVAAGRLGRPEFVVLDRQELGAERLHLFLHRRPHIGRRDHGTQPPRGGDGLEAGDADAHDEDFRCRNGACRRHHHRHGAIILGGAVDHRLVAGEVGLRGKHVHCLGARDARHELHGEGRDARLGHGGERGVVAMGVHRRDHRGAGFVAVELGVRRAADFQHHVGSCSIGSRAERCAGLDEILVGDARGAPGSGFDDDLEAEAGKPLHRVGRGGHARLLRIDFPGYEDCLSHRKALSVGTLARRRWSAPPMKLANASGARNSLPP